MPFKYVWRLVVPACNEAQAEDDLDAQKSWKAAKTQNERGIWRSWMQLVPEILVCDEQEDRPAKCVIFQHCEHFTEARSPRKLGLNLKMKRAICEWVSMDRAKPNAILNRLIERFNLNPCDANGLLPKVQNFAKHFRRVHLNETAWVDDMVTLVKMYRFREGLDDTAAFVLGVYFDEYGEPKIGCGTDDEPLLVGFTTKVMLGRLQYAATNVFHIDATFKTNTSRYPVFVVGVSDLARRFHPVAFFISSSCKETQYRAAMKALVQLYEELCGQTVVLSYVMADAEPGQRNAIETVV